MKSVTFPAYRQLKESIEHHQIVIDLIEASFCNVNPFDKQSRVFNPPLCGQRLMFGDTHYRYMQTYVRSVNKHS